MSEATPARVAGHKSAAGASVVELQTAGRWQSARVSEDDPDPRSRSDGVCPNGLQATHQLVELRIGEQLIRAARREICKRGLIELAG